MRLVIEMAQDPDIQFKPITDGLGFHPFSDGLPYAPVSPGSKPQAPRPQIPSFGSGAVSAGPATYVPPRIAVPVAQTVARPAQNLVPAPSQVKAATSSRVYGLGYMIKRIFAYVIDSAFNLAL